MRLRFSSLSELDYEQSLFPLRDSLTTLADRHARHVSTPQAISRSLARLLVSASTVPVRAERETSRSLIQFKNDLWKRNIFHKI